MKPSEDFESWYERTRPRLVRTLLVACSGDRDIAAEAADEAMVRALERWTRVGAMDSPAAWTYRTALHLVRRQFRRHTIEKRVLRRWAVGEGHVEADHSTELWSLVADLDRRERNAIALRYLGGFSEEEVGKVLGMTTGSASSLLSRARARLRTSLSSQEVSGAR